MYFTHYYSTEYLHLIFSLQEFLKYVRENTGLTRPQDDLYQVAELVPGALICEVRVWC